MSSEENQSGDIQSARQFFAEQNYTEASRLYRSLLIELERCQSTCLSQTGQLRVEYAHCLTKQKKYAEARHNAEQALDELSRIDSPASAKSRAFSCLGICAWYMFGPEQSLPYFQEAAKCLLLDPSASHARHLEVLDELGLALHASGNHNDAISTFLRALQLSNPDDDPSQIARIKRRLSNVYQDAGFFDLALGLLHDIEPTTRASAIERIAWLNAAAMLAEQTESIASAEQYYKEAVQLFSEAKPPRSEFAAVLSNAALLSLDLGKIDEAMRLVRFMALICRENAPLSARLGLLRVKARIARSHADHHQALQIWKEADSILRQSAGADELRIAEVIAIQAELLWEVGDKDRALSLLDLEPLHSSESIIQPAYVETAILRARFLMDQNDISTAQRLLTMAFAAELPRGQTEAEWKLQAAVSQLADMSEKLSAAIFFGKLAVRTIQKSISALPPLRSERRHFLGARIAPFQRLIDVLIRSGRLPEATQLQGMMKTERLFHDLSRDQRVDLRTEELKLSASECNLEETYARLRNEAKLVRSHGISKEDALANTGMTLDQIRHRAGEFLNEVLSETWREDAHNQTSSLSTVPPASTNLCVLRFACGTNEVAATATCGSEHIAYKIPLTHADLAQLVFNFRQAIAERSRDFKPIAERLYDLLIRPIAQLLKSAEYLECVVDDTLRYLPLACLHDGDKFLISSVAISTRTAAKRVDNDQTSRTDFNIIAFGTTEGTNGSNPLPHVSTELDAIRLYRPDCLSYLNDQFTVERLRAAIQSRPHILHIACHFHHQPAATHHSYFVIGNSETLPLSIFRQPDFSLRGINLVVLSGCDTALTDDGDCGPESLAGIMQARGAGQVVGTLWSIADVGAAILMREFYRHLPAQYELNAPAKCLQKAQISLLSGAVTELRNHSTHTRGFGVDPQDADYTHPYFWAGFACYVPGH